MKEKAKNLCSEADSKKQREKKVVRVFTFYIGY